MKKKPARKGRFFHALNVPRTLCRTPRKETPGQDHGVLFPCGVASAPLFCAEKIAGAERVLSWYSRRNVRTGTPVFRPGMGEGAAQRAGRTRHFLRRNAASLHAAAAGVMRTGTPVFRPGMGEVAAQRAGGTRPFLRRCAASLQAAAAGVMRTGMPVFRPGMGEGAAQRAGGTRPFLRRCAASLHAAASAAAVRGTDCKIFQKTAKRSEKKLTPRGDCAKL